MFFQATVDLRSELEAQGASFDINQFINAAFTVAIIFGILFVFAFLIWGAYEWLTAGGDKSKVEAARSRILNALVGMAILASAWVIFSIVDSFFGTGLVATPSGSPGLPGRDCTSASCSCGGVICNGYCDNNRCIPID